MKRRTFAIALILAVGILAVPSAEAGGWFGLHIGSDGVGFSMGFSTWEPYTDRWYDPSWSIDFDTALSPYGEWIWVDGLGRVWQPFVAASWRPYTYGRWVWTNYGWTWVAYEPWGYIPHHFGRWALCGSGWVWVPGYTYTPAAVVWLSGGSLVGWYAAPPPGWSNAWWRGYDRGYRHGYRNGYWDGWRDARYATWVAWNDFTTDNVARRAWSWHEVERRVPRGATRPLPSAPRRSEVERRLGRPVPVVKVSERTVEVGARSVRIARPEGVRRDIERYAGDTVNRGLDRRIAGRIERKAAAGRWSVSPRSPRAARVPNRAGGTGVTGWRAPEARGVERTSGTTSRTRSIRPSERRSAPTLRTSTRSTVTRRSSSTTRTSTRSRASAATTLGTPGVYGPRRSPSRTRKTSMGTRTITHRSSTRSLSRRSPSPTIHTRSTRSTVRRSPRVPTSGHRIPVRKVTSSKTGARSPSPHTSRSRRSTVPRRGARR